MRFQIKNTYGILPQILALLPRFSQPSVMCEQQMLSKTKLFPSNYTDCRVFQHTTPSDQQLQPLSPMLTLRLRVGTCNSSRYWPSQRTQVERQHQTRQGQRILESRHFCLQLSTRSLQRIIYVTMNLCGQQYENRICECSTMTDCLFVGLRLQ